MKQMEGHNDMIEAMLWEAYSKEIVPKDVNIRLKNQLACKEVMGTNKASFWWLPAMLSTVISIAFGIILCTIYVIVNIRGAQSWMPNLLQLVSGIWLKVNLIALAVEMLVSWIVTFLGIWKGNLFQDARIF